MYLITMVPNIKGITEVQRKGKKALLQVMGKKGQKGVMYLSDRNKIFAVVMSVTEYERLTAKDDLESEFWLKASESSLDFWKDPSNDVYEKLTESA